MIVLNDRNRSGKANCKGEALHEEEKKTRKKNADTVDPHVTWGAPPAVRRRIADVPSAAAATPSPRHPVTVLSLLL